MVIYQSFNKSVKQVDYYSCLNVIFYGYGKREFSRSGVTCHKCRKKGCIKKDYIYNENGSSRDSSQETTRNLPEWVTNKPVVSYVKYC